MQGSSPFAYQSQSFHSESYQPKLEAQFMKDFSCCGMKLANMHDLMEHYEGLHHQQMGEMQKRQVNEPPAPDPKAAIASNAAAALKDPQAQQQAAQARTQPTTPRRSNTPVQSQRTPKQAQQNFTSLPTPQAEDDTVGDMEMDDDFSTQTAMPQQYQMQQPQVMQRGQFGQAQRAPPLDLSGVNGSNAILQHQGFTDLHSEHASIC